MKVTKIIMAVCIIALTAGTTMAQNGRFSIGAELGLPMGTFGDGSGIGFGGTLGYEHPIGDMMGIGLRAGYLTFSGKDFTVLGVTTAGASQGMIPAQAFFKYYFSEAQDGFYAMANLGIHRSSYKIPEISFLGIVVQEAQTVSNTNLSYAPEIGYHLANIDIGIRYQIISGDGGSSAYLGARLAYVFGEK